MALLHLPAILWCKLRFDGLRLKFFNFEFFFRFFLFLNFPFFSLNFVYIKNDATIILHDLHSIYYSQSIVNQVNPFKI